MSLTSATGSVAAPRNLNSPQPASITSSETAQTRTDTAPARTSHPSQATSDAQAPRPAVLGNSSTAAGISVSIDSLNPTVLTQEGTLTVSGTIRNDQSAPLTNPQLVLSVGQHTPISVEALTHQLSESLLPRDAVAETPLGRDLGAGESADFSFTVPVAQLPFHDTDNWGPRVLSVSATSQEASGEDRTITVWDPGLEVSPLHMSVATAWTSENFGATSNEMSALTQIAQLTGSTLAIDPSVIPLGPDSSTARDKENTSSTSNESESASSDTDAQSSHTRNSSGGTAGESQTKSTDNSSAQGTNPTRENKGNARTEQANRELMFSLWSQAREFIALPSADADLGALAIRHDTPLLTKARQSIDNFPATPTQAGWTYTTQATSTSSNGQLNPLSPRNESSPETTGSSPSSNGTSHSQSGTSTSVATPQDPRSTAAPTIHTQVVWHSRESFGTQSLSAFADSVNIAPLGTLTPEEELDFTPTARVNVNANSGATIVSEDPQPSTTVLSQHQAIADVLGWDTSTTADQLDAVQALRAFSAITLRERPNASRTIFAAVPRTTPISARLTERLSALLGSRWVQGISFSEVTQSEPTDIARQNVTEVSLPEDTVAAMDALNQASTTLAPLVRASSNPKAVEGEIDGSLLPALSASINPSEQKARAQKVVDHVGSLMTKIQVESSGSVNLINKSAAFPVRLRNSFDWDMTVSVTLIPSDPRLRAETARDQILPAGSVTTVDVPVNAIGSGDIEVRYVVTTPDGTVLDNSSSVLVRLRAGWEDAFTAGAASLIGVLFIWGLIRSIRKRANRNAIEAAEISDSSEPSEVDAVSTPTDEESL